jgi:dnd system-associated protein 4
MAGDVRRPKQFEEMLRKLCQEDNKIFLTYKDALVFAACLGFQEERKVSFDKSSEPVGMHIFKGDYDAAIFNCIGIVERNEPSIMGIAHEEEKIRIFEEYACGGLEIIEKKIFKAAGSWDQLLLELVIASERKSESLLEDITQVFQ